jgi:Ser/Thr protein kinase RdoA (MazF antagonist)
MRLRQGIPSDSTLLVDQREAALEAIEHLGEASSLCHGDFHPGNVVMTRGDKPIIIDWTTATSGEPAVDAARTSLLLQLGELPPGTLALIRLMVAIGRTVFHAAFLRRYYRLNPAARRAVAQALLPVAVSRLAIGISDRSAYPNSRGCTAYCYRSGRQKIQNQKPNH